MSKKILMMVSAAGLLTLLMTTGSAMAGGYAYGAATDKKDRPATVEVIKGSTVKRVTVTEKASKRLDIHTGEIANDGAHQLSVPYSSIVYDISGGTWVYTMPQPLTYVRQSVEVQTIKGETAFLKSGPVPGTKIVTVGVAEIYGAEKGLGH